MLTQIINGHILTPQGWLKDGSVLISDGKILEVTNSDLAVIGATVIDAKGMYIVPGFVSMHAHGGAGHDFTEGTTEAFQKATQAHLAHGATSIFPTLSSTSFDNIKCAVTTCEELMKAPGNIIQGLHQRYSDSSHSHRSRISGNQSRIRSRIHSRRTFLQCNAGISQTP